MFFAVIAIILVPAISLAQATVKNESSKKITIWSTDYVFQFVIDPGGKVFANDKFTPSTGEVSFFLYVREGQDKENFIGRITKQVANGKFSIDNGDIDGTKAAAKKEAQPVAETAPEMKTTSVFNQTKPMMLSITNSSDFKFFFLDGPCAGLALNPRTTSVDKYPFYMGQIELTVKHKNAKEPTKQDSLQKSDAATDKTGGKPPASIGAGGADRNYSQKVVSTIITEKQTSLTITNSDLSVMGGAPAIRTFLKSLIPYKIVFVGGPFKGALRYNSFTKKADMGEGFNSLAIQFVGADGQKYQADLEVIVTKFDRPLILREMDIKNKRVIKTR